MPVKRLRSSTPGRPGQSQPAALKLQGDRAHFSFRLARKPFRRREPDHGLKAHGEVPEWLNGTVSKTVVRVTVPWVRIPPSPPCIKSLI
jgi:hypothetical protein